MVVPVVPRGRVRSDGKSSGDDGSYHLTFAIEYRDRYRAAILHGINDPGGKGTRGYRYPWATRRRICAPFYCSGENRRRAAEGYLHAPARCDAVIPVEMVLCPLVIHGIVLEGTAVTHLMMEAVRGIKITALRYILRIAEGRSFSARR